jgi:shikimate kinase
VGKSNIVLIGMPGSGKSTVGVLLAKVLGYDFVDTDLLIQIREGGTLEEIIREKGIDTFLDIEGEVCGSLAAEKTVVATGGSVIYRSRAVEHLREGGRLVYLQVGLDELAARLSDLTGRGVVLREGQTLADLYAERTVLYERWADITVAEGDMTLEETVAAAAKALSEDI